MAGAEVRALANTGIPLETRVTSGCPQHRGNTPVKKLAEDQFRASPRRKHLRRWCRVLVRR
jgi:hypothetical protein